ncbi:DUF362 domain-containing protein [Helicovermis profundi]|uniref:Ferredoxin n=1 Tax=Helicovermis profundi TaxID=3065157 RepID=A0AAU9E5P9_9FIRM|nr:DUF362 domain-containing protein [Clostridia bacterium S502]
MSKVYFKKYKGSDTEILSKIGKELLANIINTESIKLEKNIPIKVHFGEKGNTTFVPASCYNGIIDYLEENDINSKFIETNVLYRGSRTTRDSHINLAKEHGFTRLPIIIADGDMGEAVHEVTINKKYFDKVKLGAAYEDYNQILVISHFKGHGLAGFGGALKQLAMGFASRSGKMAQHSVLSPTVNGDKCISCGLCVKKCDVDAIEIKDFAIIDDKKCVGCAGCIAVCPVGAIANDWGAMNFREKVAEYAYGAQLNKNHIYISFMMNITKECDCMGQHMDPIAENFGVFASLDPVAMDSACLDILQNESDKKLFENGRETLLHCKEIGFSSGNYELIEIK